MLYQCLHRGLAIDLRRDHVQARDKSDQVRDHQSRAEFLDDTHRRERSRADVHPPWISGAVAHDVPSHIAASALEPNLAFPGRWLEIARHLREHWPARNLLQRLAQYL